MATLFIAGGGTFIRSTHVYEERQVSVYIADATEALVRGAIFEWKIGDRIVATGTSSRYTLDDADIGKQLSVTALLLDSNGNNTIRVASVNPKIVTGLNDQPSGSLSMDIEPLGAGVRLTAIDKVEDEDGRGSTSAMTYQWIVNGKPVSGANGSVFTVEQPAGETIELRGTYTDSLGHVHTVSTGNLPLQPDNPATLGILGTVAPDAVLRASAIDADGIETIHYAWDVMDKNGTWTPVDTVTSQEFRIGATSPAAVRVFVDLADARGATSKEVIVLGTDGADTIRSQEPGEAVYAAGGDDLIHSSTGAHRVDGGAGFDIYVHDGGGQVYRQAEGKPGEWIVASTDLFGTGVLTDVERVLLRDRAVALDIDGHGGQAFRLYEAAFDRSADMVGLGFWISRLDLGVSLKTVAEAFVASPEFRTLYGANPTNAEIVAKFYANILDRTPDAAGVAFWNHVLDTGAASVADVLVEFSESAEDIAALVGAVQNGIHYMPYGGN